MKPPNDPAFPAYDEPRGTCPRCGSASVTHILFGMPTPDIVESRPQWVALGGCSIVAGYPDRECDACGYGWEAAPHSEPLD